MPCLFGHDWRDVAVKDDTFYQECRRCLTRRKYLRGFGPAEASWSDADLKEALNRDDRAVVRVVVTSEGKPSGMMLVKQGRLSIEVLERMSAAIDGWDESGKKALLLEESADVRFEFVTVDQLTQ